MPLERTSPCGAEADVVEQTSEQAHGIWKPNPLAPGSGRAGGLALIGFALIAPLFSSTSAGFTSVGGVLVILPLFACLGLHSLMHGGHGHGGGHGNHGKSDKDGSCPGLLRRPESRTREESSHDTRNRTGLWSLAARFRQRGGFIIFTLSFTKPQTPRDWRSFSAFSAFLVALFAEMYGFPLDHLPSVRLAAIFLSGH